MMNKIETIAKYKDINIELDWNSLLQFKAKREEQLNAAKRLGNLIEMLCLIVIILVLGSFILNGNLNLQAFLYPRTILVLIIYFLIDLILFAEFLKRDRNIFDNSI